MGLPPRVSRDDPTPSPRPRLGAEAGRASRRAGNEATPGDGATEAAEALGGAAEQRTARSRLGAALLPAPRARGRALLSRAPLWEPGRSRLAKGVEGPLRLRRLAQPQDSRCAKGLARGDVIRYSDDNDPVIPQTVCSSTLGRTSSEFRISPAPLSFRFVLVC